MTLYYKWNDSTCKAWNHAPSQAHFNEIKALLKTFNALQISGQIGTIHNSAEWRIDLQSPSATAFNVQIQKNNAPNPSTLAGVMVPFTIMNAIGATASTDVTIAAGARKRAEQVRYAVAGALIQSAATHGQLLNDRGRAVPGSFVIKMQVIAGQFDH